VAIKDKDQLKQQKEKIGGRLKRHQDAYNFIYGIYWYLEDTLTLMREVDSPSYNVRTMDPDLRAANMEVKHYLLSLKRQGKQLEREEVFPMYMSVHRQAKIIKSLKSES